LCHGRHGHRNGSPSAAVSLVRPPSRGKLRRLRGNRKPAVTPCDPVYFQSGSKHWGTETRWPRGRLYIAWVLGEWIAWAGWGAGGAGNAVAVSAVASLRAVFPWRSPPTPGQPLLCHPPTPRLLALPRPSLHFSHIAPFCAPLSWAPLAFFFTEATFRWGREEGRVKGDAARGGLVVHFDQG
jgi:hypothetical protein